VANTTSRMWCWQVANTTIHMLPFSAKASKCLWRRQLRVEHLIEQILTMKRSRTLVNRNFEVKQDFNGFSTTHFSTWFFLASYLSPEGGWTGVALGPPLCGSGGMDWRSLGSPTTGCTMGLFGKASMITWNFSLEHLLIQPWRRKPHVSSTSIPPTFAWM
jgi:hypothetical protein